MPCTVRCSAFAFACVLLLLLLRASSAAATPPNGAERSSLNVSSLTWATAKDTRVLEQEREQNLSLLIEDIQDEEFDSLDGMLQWAIGHSRPEKLNEAAQEIQNLTVSELGKRQLEIKELMEKLKVTSDAELMKIAMTDLESSSLAVEDRQRALQELLELVDPIDNANDLDKLGGLVLLIKELDRPEEELRISAAWVLGKASQNNELVQAQLLQHGVLPRLMEMVQSNSTEEAVKALYAVSAIIRNYPAGQVAFYSNNGIPLLEEIMTNESSDIRLRRKSLFLVADLAEQLQETDGATSKFLASKGLLMSIVDMVVVVDLDTQEKALMAIRSLGCLSSTMHTILKEDCLVVVALQTVNAQLDQLMQAEELDFVKELQALCQMVISMFSQVEETGPASNSMVEEVEESSSDSSIYSPEESILQLGV